MVDCSRLIMNHNVREHDSSQHERLLKLLERLGHRFFRWYETWVTKVADVIPGSLIAGDEHGLAKDSNWYQDFMGQCQFITLIYNRLYVALGGGKSDSVERQSQSFAKALQVIHESQEGNPDFPVPPVLVRAITANLSTADEWQVFIDSSTRLSAHLERELASPVMYQRWMGVVGTYTSDVGHSIRDYVIA